MVVPPHPRGRGPCAYLCSFPPLPSFPRSSPSGPRKPSASSCTPSASSPLRIEKNEILRSHGCYGEDEKLSIEIEPSSIIFSRHLASYEIQ